MTNKYRRIYTHRATKYGLITSIIMLFAVLGSIPGVEITSDGDKVCRDVCVSYINVTSKIYDLYIYNNDNLKLSFTPDIEDYDLYVKDGRFKSGWRPVDFTTNTKARKDRKYVFKFQRYKKYEFKLVGYKKPYDNVKWSFFGADTELDPLWSAPRTHPIGNHSVGGSLRWNYTNVTNKTIYLRVKACDSWNCSGWFE